MDTSAGKTQTAYEVARLFQEYRKAPSESLRNQIALGYLHIARIVAARFSGKGVEYDDLYQVASLALIKAVERFDPSKGVQFQSFATPSVVGEVKNYFRDKLHALNLPRSAAALARRIERARAELSQQLMRSPTLAELSERLELPEADVSYALAMRGAFHPSSLDEQLSDSETPVGALLGVDEEGYARVELRETVKKLLSNMDEVGRRILTERYFNGRSQREVAEMIGVSQMSVSRAERKALERIRALWNG